MTTTGRPRDPDIDAKVIAAAQSHLASQGYEAMSVVAVAEEAGTTRQAIYRRWPTKADLATAAIAAMSRADDRPDTDDPYADLLAELRAFHQAIVRPNGVGMVGSMLMDATEDELRMLFRDRIVGPRRARLRHILDRAAEAGLIADDADLEYAVAACTGTFYALHLAGGPIAKTWPKRIAALVWRSVGGQPPGG